MTVRDQIYSIYSTALRVAGTTPCLDTGNRLLNLSNAAPLCFLFFQDTPAREEKEGELGVEVIFNALNHHALYGEPLEVPCSDCDTI